MFAHVKRKNSDEEKEEEVDEKVREAVQLFVDKLYEHDLFVETMLENEGSFNMKSLYGDDEEKFAALDTSDSFWCDVTSRLEEETGLKVMCFDVFGSELPEVVFSLHDNPMYP